MNQCPTNKMDNEALIQMEFKSLVDPSIHFLERLDVKSRNNAICYLLNVLKGKFPDSCEQVVHSLFPGFGAHLNESQESKKNIKFILNAKNEVIKSENVASTDLNQNFEKILCKEEFMCIDEVERMDVDEGSATFLGRASSEIKQKQHVSSLAFQGPANSHALRVMPNALVNVPDIGCENILSSDSIRANKLSQSSQVRISSAIESNHSNRNSCLIARKWALPRRTSNLGEGYVFHPHSELTVFYHHSTGEFQVRAFKKQFQFRLKAAFEGKHKQFLSKFYKNFVRTGLLAGTKPPLRALQALRAQREQEWRERKERKQLALQWKQEERLHNEFGFEPEVQLPSFIPQGVLRFEEVFDKESTENEMSFIEKEALKIEDIPFVGKQQIITERKSTEQASLPLSMEADAILRMHNFNVEETSNNLNDELRVPPERNINSTMNGLMSTSNISIKPDVSTPVIHLGISEVDRPQNALTSRSVMENAIMNQQPLQNYRTSFSVDGSNPLSLMSGMMDSTHQQQQQQQQRLTASSSMLDSLDNNLYDGSILSQMSTSANTQPSQSPSLNSCSQDSSLLNAPPYQGHTDHQQQQQHVLMHQQQLSVSCGGSNASANSAIVCGAPSSSSSYSEQHTQNFGPEDNELSHDDDEEDNELDELEPKQQLIDGGSSSSTSLQAPLGSNLGIPCGTGIVKKAKPSYNCLLCPKSYRKRKSLLDHYKIHPGYCHDCGQPNGNSLEEIIQHNRTVHSKEFPFVCETCGESYSRRQQFHAHVESHTKKDLKTYSCVECGLKFPHKKLHQQHLDDTGHRADGAICEVCGAIFPSKNALYQHIIRVHKKDNFFECHICQNRFSLKANLERHVQLHTEIKRTYVCDLCGSSYFTQPALKDHYSNAHTDTSECKCTLCGKRFGSVKSLQRHLPSHSEERPHCCTYCDQTFKWKTHLVRHKQTVHGNQPSPKKVKRFSKVDEELVPVPDMPGPPPSKIAKKSSTPKGKQQQQQQQQQPPQQGPSQTGALPTPPPLSSTPTSTQQEQFNAAALNNNSSQSSTASTSQHSLSTNDSQQQQQQSNSMYSQNFNTEKLVVHSQKQQTPQIQCGPGGPGQRQQHPTPPPLPQHPHHTPSNMHPSEGGFIARINNFAPSAHDPQQYHFEQNAATNAASYQQQQQQQQIINQYQQQHNPQQPPQFSHHIPPPQQQSQVHHQQLLHQHQLQQQQQQQQAQAHRHNQQRSPHHHHHPTQAQQIQLQQQPSHSPQHHGRLQSPPQRPSQQNTPVHQQQQQQQQQQPQQYQPCGPSLQQQHTTNDAWRGFSGSTPVSTPGAGNHSQQQNANDVKDNSNKFYIVDSAEFLGLPLNVANAGNGRTPGRGIGSNGTQPQQQPQQQQPGLTNKQQESAPIGADVISFQNLWPSQINFGNASAHQQQHQSSSANPNQTAANPAGVVSGDMHSYNNIGSILTNLIDNTPSTMEYNFDLMQPGSSAAAVSQADQHHQHQSQQQQQQQQQQTQEHATPSDTFGLQQPPGVSSLARSHIGVYGSTSASIYDTHQQDSSLSGIPEHQQQKNSFQPYHPHHVLQPHATIGVSHPLAPTAHHPLAAAHLLPPPAPHPSVYQRSGSYPGIGEEPKTSLPPITDYMHHMHQQHQQLAPPHVQQTAEHLLYYHPVKND